MELFDRVTGGHQTRQPVPPRARSSPASLPVQRMGAVYWILACSCIDSVVSPMKRAVGAKPTIIAGAATVTRLKGGQIGVPPTAKPSGSSAR